MSPTRKIGPVISSRHRFLDLVHVVKSYVADVKIGALGLLGPGPKNYVVKNLCRLITGEKTCVKKL